MIRAAVIFLALVLAADAADLDTPRFIAITREMEEVRRHGVSVDGAAGDLGPYQFREITWRQHMPGVPFALARDEQWARACAVKHVAWLRAKLRAAGCDDGPYMVALCWNAGLARVLSGRAPMASYDYAQRAANLYFTTETRRARR